MRQIFLSIFLAFFALGANAAVPQKLTEKNILETVKKTPNLRAYYSKDARGRKVLVVTNKEGITPLPPRKVEQPRPQRRVSSTSSPVAPVGRQQLNPQRRSTQSGIPYPKRNPHRVINPYKPVNPYRDPTALPTGPPPDSN
jgi:hypothetical protein